MKKSAEKIILFGLICAGWIGSADSAFCTTPTHTSPKPSSLISGDGYQLAKTWFLPDWQADTRSYNTDNGNNDDGEGDVDKTCETYGFVSPGSIDQGLYDCSEDELLTQMSEPQKEVFADLKTISSDCSRAPWLSVGINILHVFGTDLGGSVFNWWSKQSYKYQPRSCVDTWDYILDKEPETVLNNRDWAKIMGITTNAFGYEERERKEQQIKNELAEVRKRVLAEREAAGTGLSTSPKDTSAFLENVHNNEPLPYEPL